MFKQMKCFSLVFRCSINKNSKCTYSSSNLVVYNNLTKKNERLKLNQNNFLNWYTCGPTVYDSAHIGHAR